MTEAAAPTAIVFDPDGKPLTAERAGHGLVVNDAIARMSRSSIRQVNRTVLALHVLRQYLQLDSFDTLLDLAGIPGESPANVIGNGPGDTEAKRARWKAVDRVVTDMNNTPELYPLLDAIDDL